MKTRFSSAPVFSLAAIACWLTAAGCSNTPTRSNTAALDSATATATVPAIGTTGAANSRGSASAPGTSTGAMRGGSR